MCTSSLTTVVNLKQWQNTLTENAIMLATTPFLVTLQELHNMNTDTQFPRRAVTIHIKGGIKLQRNLTKQK